MKITYPEIPGLNLPKDPELLWLFGGVLALLVAGTVISGAFERAATTERGKATAANLNARVRAWWVMSAVFSLTLVVGRVGSAVLFAMVSFLALREFVSLTPATRGDHRALLWSFFLFIPLQYYAIGKGWYGLFTTLIPIYGFLFLSIRSSIVGDTQHFLERTSEIYWGMVVCVFFPSFAPALLTLSIPGYVGQNAKLLLFFVIIVELSDVLQYVWGKLLGKRPIASKVSPNKTWEGFWGGVVCATLAGASIWWVTPFGFWVAAGMSLVITLMGFAGGLTMSAIKRDRGLKDYGTLIEGHGGVLDRIDSLCFAAPVFFQLTKFFYT